MPDAPTAALLSVRDLAVTFRTRGGDLRAVDGLGLDVSPGEVLAVVGESGSGKSVAMSAVLGLVPSTNTTISGTAVFDGDDLLAMSPARMRAVRGRRIALISQDPMTAFTPVYTIGWHIAEQLRAHTRLSKRAAYARAVELLDEVGIANPRRRVHAYPHELSGGMRQRACIAMALSCDPDLVIADEPTTALDVTTQAQILDLLARLQQAHGSAMVLITHDMGVVSQVADRIVVMYAGHAVETGARRDVFHDPQHPYTRGLLRSVPRVTGPRTLELAAIPGSPPDPRTTTEGCAFAPRCAYVHDACTDMPPLRGDGLHLRACWLDRLPDDESGDELGDESGDAALAAASVTSAASATTTGTTGPTTTKGSR